MTIIKQFKKELFILQGLSDEEINEATETVKYEVKDFLRGEVIYSPTSYEKRIGFILLGECEVRSHRGDGKVILNILGVGDSFGILAVFKDEPFPTEVYARKNTSVLFVDGSDLISMIEHSGKVSLNVIRFLAERVSFLNGRINTVTKIGVDKKLASYLLSKQKKLGENVIEFNFKKCAETIGAGRASVYRALDSLVSKGYIEAENKIIKILDIKSLEDFIK